MTDPVEEALRAIEAKYYPAVLEGKSLMPLYPREDVRLMVAAAVASEREACARIAEIWGERKDKMTDTAFVPGATQSERFASEGIAAFIRARSL